MFVDSKSPGPTSLWLRGATPLKGGMGLRSTSAIQMGQCTTIFYRTIGSVQFVLLVMIWLILSLASCGPRLSNEAKERISKGGVALLGHGGMGNRTFVPLNSKESLLEALQSNLSGTECDVRLTIDNTLVVFHDATLDRATQCNGRVEEQTWAELKDCAYRSWFYSEHVIALAELLNLPEVKGHVFSLDVKLPDGTDAAFRTRMANALHDVVERHSQEKTLVVESQDLALLKELHGMRTGATLLFYTSNPNENAALLRDAGIDGVSIDYRLVERSHVEAWQNQGLYVMLWGANTRNGNKKALNMLPDGVQSDQPAHLAKLRAE